MDTTSVFPWAKSENEVLETLHVNPGQCLSSTEARDCLSRTHFNLGLVA